MSRERFVGGFGAAGGGWILLSIFMYFIAYTTQPRILVTVYSIGIMGAVFLSVAIGIGLKYRDKQLNQPLKN